jgi:hypothetical protein
VPVISPARVPTDQLLHRLGYIAGSDADEQMHVGVHAAEGQNDDAVLHRGGIKAALELLPFLQVADDGLAEVAFEDQVVQPSVFPDSQRSRHPPEL